MQRSTVPEFERVGRCLCQQNMHFYVHVKMCEMLWLGVTEAWANRLPVFVLRVNTIIAPSVFCHRGHHILHAF